jgi:hypothetical protein
MLDRALHALALELPGPSCVAEPWTCSTMAAATGAARRSGTLLLPWTVRWIADRISSVDSPFTT